MRGQHMAEQGTVISRYHRQRRSRAQRVLLSAVLWYGVTWAAACGGPQLQPESGGPPAERAGPAPASVQAPYGVYVTNEVSGDLSVIDPATQREIATLPLGKRPRGIRVGPDAARLSIALSGSPVSPPGTDESKLPPPDRSADGIGVVSVQTLTLETILRGPQDPEQTSVSHDGTRLYIANEDKGTASVLEIVSGRTLAELEVGGEPEAVTTSPDGRFVSVTSEQDNQVSVIDTTANRVVKQIPVGPRPRDTAFLPDSSTAYITSENGASISVVNTTSQTVIETIRLTGENVRPMGAVVSPDGQRLYVSTGRGGTIVSIDTKANKPVGSVAVGTRPWDSPRG